MQNEALQAPVVSLQSDPLNHSATFIKDVSVNASLTATSFPLNITYNLYLKRLTDIVVSVAGIVLILPWAFPIAAIIIKLSSRGPVLFLQKRNKRNGEVFTCLKFRTMVVNKDADTLPAADDDERITRIGRFLRRHYIDELPQFFNVLLGDMSIIGPRPQMIADNERFANTFSSFNERHLVKPGITGLAQVKGLTGIAETEAQMKNRLSMDLHYVRHWTFWLDCKILLMTITRVFGL